MTLPATQEFLMDYWINRQDGRKTMGCDRRTTVAADCFPAYNASSHTSKKAQARQRAGEAWERDTLSASAPARISSRRERSSASHWQVSGTVRVRSAYWMRAYSGRGP